MNELNENIFKYENNDSFNNSNDNCYINSNPLTNYLNKEFNNYYNVYEKNENFSNNMKKKKTKKCNMCNLNDDKLLQAYNEGYYGVNNIPKHYYIYPKFANIEKNKKTNVNSNQKITLNNEIINKNIKKENNIDLNVENNDNNNNLISSYTNYPYPKLINISSKFFGQLHSFKQENQNINSSKTNNNINNNDENNEKENLDQNNLKENSNNQTFDISFRIKDGNNFKIKGSGKVIDLLSKQKEETKNEEEKINKINTIEAEEEQNDSGNFYFINNNITKRSIPYQNIPDNISIDDDEEENN